MVEPNDYEKDTRAMVSELRQMINDDFKFLHSAIDAISRDMTQYLAHSFTPTSTAIISLLTGLLGVAAGMLVRLLSK